jgi:hypothetical protein
MQKTLLAPVKRSFRQKANAYPRAPRAAKCALAIPAQQRVNFLAAHGAIKPKTLGIFAVVGG